MRLSDVSRTAIATLRSRAIESVKTSPLIRDPMACECLERLAGFATAEEKALLFERRLSPVLTGYIARRARKYDAAAGAFISANPSCLVVNLGCGFDTRYWRIDHGSCEYVELDLPEIVALKRQILGEQLTYPVIAASVADRSWIEAVNAGGRKRALLLAEGLLMYLPKSEVVALFRATSEGFHASRFVFEVVAEKYTRGLWKRIVVNKIRRQMGYNVGISYNYGVRNAREIESYAPGLAVSEEWSYLDDPDVRPKILRLLRTMRTQWTVTAEVGG